MYRIGWKQSIGAAYNVSDIVIDYPLYQNGWTVSIYHRSGGLKRSWILGQDGCPIASIKWELNLAGCGAGDMTVSYLDFPIDADDAVMVAYQGTRIYQGFCKTGTDPKGGDVQLQAMKVHLSRCLVNTGSLTKTVDDWISYVVQLSNVAAQGILYSSSFINTGWSGGSITLTYAYMFADKVMDDLVGRLSGRYWGVDENGFVFVRPLNSAIDDYLYQVDNPAFTGIKYSVDYSGITMTRAQVFNKATSGLPAVRVGQVGYGDGGAVYQQTLPIENVVGQIEGIINLPDNVGSTDGLNYAYAVLNNQQWLASIDVTGVQIEVYNPPHPLVGRNVKIQDSDEVELVTLDSCDANTNFKNGTLDNTNYTEGTGSVYFTATNIGDALTWNAPNFDYFTWGAQSIGFMVRSSVSGKFMSVTINGEYDIQPWGILPWGAYVWPLGTATTAIGTYTFNIPSANTWQFIQVPITSTVVISNIVFSCTASPGSPAQVNIDRIQVFELDRKIYTENIVLASYELTPADTKIGLTLKSYKLLANKNILDLQRQYGIIRAQITA